MKPLSIGVAIGLLTLASSTPVELERRGNPFDNLVSYVVNGVTYYVKPAAPAPAPAPAPAAAPPSSSNSEKAQERQMLCLVNQERRRVGLKPLSLNPAVTNAAYQHSMYQSRIQQMTHNDPQNGPLGRRLKQNGIHFGAAAENIAVAPHASAQEVFNMWMNDPPHYQNIVNPQVTYMGLACVNGYWTQDFGSSLYQTNSANSDSQGYC